MTSEYYSKAIDKRVKHFNLSQRNGNIDNMLTVSNIIIVTTTGVANNIITSFGMETKISGALVSIVLYFSLLITAVQKYYDFSRASQEHKLSSTLYENLAQTINDKKIPVQYISSQYQLIRAIAPQVEELDSKSVSINIDSSRDEEIDLDFEIQRMNNN